MNLLLILLLAIITSCSPIAKVEYYEFDENLVKARYYVEALSGDKTGNCIYYDLDGSILSESMFMNNMKHGVTKFYCDEKGKILLSVNYVKGFKDGITQSFYCNGKSRYKVLYKKNKIMCVFDLRTEDGKKIQENVLVEGTGVLYKYSAQGDVIEVINLISGVRSGYQYIITNTGHMDSIFFNNGYSDFLNDSLLDY